MRQLMNGHIFRCLVRQASFSFWHKLSEFVCGILSLLRRTLTSSSDRLAKYSLLLIFLLYPPALHTFVEVFLESDVGVFFWH